MNEKIFISSSLCLLLLFRVADALIDLVCLTTSYNTGVQQCDILTAENLGHKGAAFVIAGPWTVSTTERTTRQEKKRMKMVTADATDTNDIVP
jgi:hypothetical protein